MYIFIKTVLTAIIIVSVSEIAKKYTWAAAIIVSIPFTSLLAFMWLYYDTKNVQKIIDLSFGTIVMTIPSIIFFITLPVMLKYKQNFILSMFVSIFFTFLAYLAFIFIIKKINFNF